MCEACFTLNKEYGQLFLSKKNTVIYSQINSNRTYYTKALCQPLEITMVMEFVYRYPSVIMEIVTISFQVVRFVKIRTYFTQGFYVQMFIPNYV